MPATRVRIPDSHTLAGAPDTLLASGISDSDSTITFTSEPAALASYTDGQIALLIRTPAGGDEEWVLLDSYNGSLVGTVAIGGRGYNGSTALPHNANDEIFFQPLEPELKRIIDGEPIQPASVTIYGELGYGDDGILTPAQFTGDEDDFDAGGASILEIDTDAAGYKLTGILAPTDAKRLIVKYVGADDLTLPEQDTGSTATSRFAFPDVTLVTNQTAEILYDLTLSRWLLIGGTGSGDTTSPLTTKGDLWGYDTADARIPVGTDGDVLTADSGAAAGVSWQAAGGSVAGHYEVLTSDGDPLWVVDSEGYKQWLYSFVPD